MFSSVICRAALSRASCCAINFSICSRCAAYCASTAASRRSCEDGVKRREGGEEGGGGEARGGR
eukprot:2590059-Prymnesium_polylepis.1